MAGKSRNPGETVYHNFDKYTDTPAGAALVAAGPNCNDLKLENIYPVSYRKQNGGTFASRLFTLLLSCPAPALRHWQPGANGKPAPLAGAKLQIPLWLSTIRCTIASPNPVPLWCAHCRRGQTAGTGAYVVPGNSRTVIFHLEPGAIRLRSALTLIQPLP